MTLATDKPGSTNSASLTQAGVTEAAQPKAQVAARGRSACGGQAPAALDSQDAKDD